MRHVAISVLAVLTSQLWCEELLHVPDAILDRSTIQTIQTSRTTFRSIDFTPTIKNKVPETTIEITPEGRRMLESLEPKAEQGEKTDAWRELFNGKDLTGWKALGSAIWKVENGEMVGGQFGDPKRSGVIRTDEVFQDFEIELEFQIDEHGKYNSGVYLRNDPAKASRTGYQVNIGRGAAGEFCGGVYTTQWLAKGDETDTVRKPKEWNTLRILAKGARLEVDLNGKRVVDFTDPKPEPVFLQKGSIGFHTYGAEGHDGWVKFKKIRIRELK